MLQRTLSFRNKFVNGRLGLLGALVLFGANRGNAQEKQNDSIPKNPVAAIKPISPTSLLKSAPSTVKFPTELLARKTDYKAPQINVELDGHGRIEIDSLLLLPPEDFIATVLAPGPNTSLAEFASLSATQQRIQIKKFAQRPLRVEIDTVLVVGKNQYELNGQKRNATNFVDGGFIPNLNLIKLTYYAPGVPAEHSKYKTSCKLAETLNNNIIFVFIHELQHYFNNSIDLSSLSFNQISQIPIHDELSADLTTLYARRKLLSITNDFARAFPDIAYMMDEYAGISVKQAYESDVRQNPMLHRRLQDIYLSCEDYVYWLFENKLTDQPSTEEMDVILKSVIRDSQISFMVNKGQFEKHLKSLLGKTYHTLAGKYVQTKNKQHFEQIDFDDVLRQMYSDRLGLLSPATSKAFVHAVFLSWKDCHFGKVKDWFQEYADKFEEMRKTVYDNPGSSKYDATVPRNRGISKDVFSLLNRGERNYD